LHQGREAEHFYRIFMFMSRLHHKILKSASGFCIICLLFLFGAAFVSAGAPGLSRDELRAGRAAEVLQQWYNPGDGLWKTTSWWNAANALTALIEYSKRTGSEEYWPVIANTFDRCKEFELYDSSLGKNKLIRNFLNPWWDDEGWWVLVWLDAYDLTGEPRYLEMARTIFEDMTLGWDEVCGGGVYWKKPNIGKHTITNGLFLLAAIRLHQHSPAIVRGQTYLQWALATWRWLDTHGIVNAESLVENGLNDLCELQTGACYSYNQGVVLGGLVELGLVTHNPSLIERARKIATAATGRLIYPNGLLKEGGEPQLSGDSSQFKGIFMRYLARLYAITPDPLFADFIQRNAEAIWELARDPKTDQLGALWGGPFDGADAARQSSALDGLNAVLALGARNGKALALAKQDSAPAKVRVMTWQVSPGLDEKGSDQGALVQRVKRQAPDVLALQGLQNYTAERLSTEAAEWGHGYTVFFAKGGGRSLPMGLTSRRPIVVQEKLGRDMSHGLLHGRTYGLDFLTLQLSGEDRETRRAESKRIVFRIQQLLQTRREAIVLGDFNAFSPFDAALYPRGRREAAQPGIAAPDTGPDYSVMSLYLGCSLVDLGAQTPGSPVDRITWFAPQGRPTPPQPIPGYSRGRIDYILATPGVVARVGRCRVLTGERDRSGSGHQPVVVDLEGR
jgi:predicted alpha-1,6-mannanase (GH76 family)/exonuclease III